jgi:hypothetical protein
VIKSSQVERFSSATLEALNSAAYNIRNKKMSDHPITWWLYPEATSFVEVVVCNTLLALISETIDT